MDSTRLPDLAQELTQGSGNSFSSVSYLVVGDNRANSSDSVAQCRGRIDGTCEARFVRADQVVGTVGWRYWPLPPGGALRGS